MVDLRSVAGRGDDLGAGAGNQARYAFQLPLRVHEQAALAHDQVERRPDGAQFGLGQRAAGRGGGSGRRVTPAWIHRRAARERPSPAAPATRRAAGAAPWGRRWRSRLAKTQTKKRRPTFSRPPGSRAVTEASRPGRRWAWLSDEPAAVGGADEVDPVEAEGVEGLVHPLGGALGLPHGLVLDAAAGVAGGVERVDGAFGAERGGCWGTTARSSRPAPWIRTHGRPGLGGGVRGAVPVDVRGAEARLHVRLGAGGRAHRVERVAGGEVAVAQLVAHVAADVAASRRVVFSGTAAPPGRSVLRGTTVPPMWYSGIMKRSGPAGARTPPSTGGDTGTMPKRVDHEERRAQIAEALIRVAGRQGLHAVGMRDVAARGRGVTAARAVLLRDQGEAAPLRPPAPDRPLHRAGGRPPGRRRPGPGPARDDRGAAAGLPADRRGEPHLPPPLQLLRRSWP